jgi:hypothetical protein
MERETTDMTRNSLRLFFSPKLFYKVLQFWLLLTIPVISQAYPVFTEVSQPSNIEFQGETNPMSAGIGWIDYDNDGWQDLFIPNASGPNRLYHNNGDGTFDEVGASAGIQLSGRSSYAVAIGDYDGDGFDDIFVANLGVNSLLKNNGNGTFLNVTGSAGLSFDSKTSYTASFGDIDGDGDLDLYVGQWSGLDQPGGVCQKNDLYANNGDGTFTNISVDAGADHVGCTFDNPMIDFDSDGDLDIFVVNDNVGFGVANPALENEMLGNFGVDENGIPVLVPIGDSIGVGQTMTAMGVAIGDYNNDGYLDFYRAQIGTGLLSTADGTGGFVTGQLSATDSQGFGLPIENLDTGKGWGTVFFDADNDGDLDLYRGNSDVGFTGVGQSNSLFLNDGAGTFVKDLLQSAGLQSVEAGLGIALADYDNDGDMDLAVHGRNGVVNLYRNDTPASNNWIGINLDGENPNHRAIGAEVRLTSSDGVHSRNYLRVVHSGSGHGSTHQFPIHVGLGDHIQVSNIQVRWPSGCIQSLQNQDVNQRITISESGCSLNHTISGTVRTASGNPVAGITFQIADNFGFNSFVTTDALGRYSSEAVPDGTYIVFPASASYTVTPVEGNVFVNVSGANVTKDFLASPK